MEWQMIGSGYWIFGPKIRGMVRSERAVVHHDSFAGGDREHEWAWAAYGTADGQPAVRGRAESRAAAAHAAEEALGIKED
jgi:cephalosporin-C deacetylase-like acetyl esterase